MSADQSLDELRSSNAHMLPALQQEFKSRARIFRVRKGQIILAEGVENNDVFLIVAGKVKVSRFSRLGRELILRELEAGSVFGELAAIGALPRSASVVALEDAELAHMRGDQFELFVAEAPGAALWLSRLLVDRVHDLTERVFELATKQAPARILSELLRLAALTPASGESDRVRITAMPTHAELAARIGSHREAVSRELGTLAKEGVVRQTGRTLEILSLTRLKAVHDRLSR